MKKSTALLLLLSAFTPLFSQPCRDFRYPAELAGGVIDMIKNSAGNYVLLNREGPGAFMEINSDGDVLKSVTNNSHHFRNIRQIGNRYVQAGSFSSVGCSDPDIQGSEIILNCLNENGSQVWQKILELYQVADQARYVGLMDGADASSFFIATGKAVYQIDLAGNILNTYLYQQAAAGGNLCYIERGAAGGFTAFFNMPDYKLRQVETDAAMNLLAEKIIPGVTLGGIPRIQKIPAAQGGGWTATYDRVGAAGTECRFFRISAEGQLLWSNLIGCDNALWFSTRALTPVGNEFWMNTVYYDGEPALFRFSADGSLKTSGILSPGVYSETSQLQIFSLGGTETAVAGNYLYKETGLAYNKYGSRVTIFNCAPATGTVDAGGLPEFAVFPNPASGQFTVSSGTDEPCRWEMFDPAGRLIGSGELSGNESIRTPRSGLGYVMFRLRSADGREAVRKIMLD